MKHKYSTIALIFLGTLLIIAAIGTAIDSDDLDEVCSQNDSVLYRYGGSWVCAKFNDIVTITNMTVINNQTVYETSKINVTGDIYMNKNSILNASTITATTYYGDGSQLTGIESKTFGWWNDSGIITNNNSVAIIGNLGVGDNPTDRLEVFDDLGNTILKISEDASGQFTSTLQLESGELISDGTYLTINGEASNGAGQGIRMQYNDVTTMTMSLSTLPLWTFFGKGKVSYTGGLASDTLMQFASGNSNVKYLTDSSGWIYKWQYDNSAGNPVTIGTTNNNGINLEAGGVTAETTVSTAVPLTVKGAVSQSADLFNIVNNANAEILTIDDDGAIRITGTASESASEYGRVYNSAAYGLSLQAGQGSTYDFALWNDDLTQKLVLNPTGTRHILFNSDSLGNDATVAIGGDRFAAEAIDSKFFIFLEGAASKVGMVLRAAPSQTAHLLDFRDGSNNVLNYFNKNSEFVNIDNKKMTFGTGGDATILYNESDLIIDPKVVGNGKVIIKGELEVESYERHIQIPVQLSGSPANQPDQVDDFTIGGLQFSSTTDNCVYFQWEIPDDWDGTSNVTVEIDWYPDSGSITGADVIKGDFMYRSIAEDDLMNDGGQQNITGIISNVSQYNFTHTPFILDYQDPIQPLQKQDHIFVKFCRDVSVTNDFSGTVVATQFEVLYNSISLPTSN